MNVLIEGVVFSNVEMKSARPSGLTSGKIRTTYTYSTYTTDPDGDELYYMFDWSDGTYSTWFGPYDSEDIAEASHEWTKKGNYEIRAIAKDENGVFSNWSDPLSVSMPKNKAFNFNFNLLSWLFERYPNAFPILRHMLGL